MERSSIRIAELELRNFRNVIKGSFRMPSYLNPGTSSPDILGIYGQNGSGKTAAIEALDIMQKVMAGDTLPGESHEYINIDSEEAEVLLSFSIDDEYILTYSLTIGDDNGDAVIAKEKISRKGKGEREHTLIAVHRGEKKITPARIMRSVPSRDRRIDILVSMRLAEREDVSFFFSDDGGYAELTELGSIASEIILLREYARTSFIVLSADNSSLHADKKLPISYQMVEEGSIIRGSLLIDISSSFTISEMERNFLEKLFRSMNIVLGKIIPNLEIGLFIKGEEINEKGEKGFEAELVSYKNGTPIPLRFESVGIIKLISILSVLLAVYNSRSVCLVIDEFDASIFEYLLGEIISVFRSGAKGQLIFTSHNLRILEMVDKESIIFSTSDPMRRYTRIKAGKGNLRDDYLKALLLGSSDRITGASDKFEISRALRSAWRADE